MKKARNNYTNTLLLCLSLLQFTARPCWSRLGDALCVSPAEWEAHPRLCGLAETIMRQEQTPQALARELFDFAAENGWIIDFRDDTSSSFPKLEEDESALVQSSRRQTSSLRASSLSSAAATSSVPIVLAHGMGDSCFNGGMQHVTQLMTDWLGVYAVCIPTGGSPSDDTNDGFFLVRNGIIWCSCVFVRVFDDNGYTLISRLCLSLSLLFFALFPIIDRT
jgi:Palmitoyl protein thioesterase